ncbi:hypothetical protein NDU88_003160 [Pleurodeles waltl]|uniref:Uncharacterized protein n=1 Tax=Pleurodeles waltl TaxID=8319 RepID=A0AAV7KY61_PLEWA|nr:hypothetical protein NDU88_003160 [Pleurodeles waltl]
MRTCADSAPGNTEAPRGTTLSIGSLPDPRESEAVKGMDPPDQGRGGEIQWWRTKEPASALKGEQRRPRDEEDPEDARTRLRQPGVEPESGYLWTRHRDEDRWPRGADE